MSGLSQQQKENGKLLIHRVPKIFATAALASLLLLTSCGSGKSVQSDQSDAPSVQASASSSTTPTEIAAPEASPEITLRKQSLSAKTTNVEAFTSVELPELTGVDSTLSKKFANEAKSLLVNKLESIAEKSEEYWPIPADYCQHGSSDLCGTELRAEAQEHEIYDQMASISYTAGYNLAGGTSNEDVLSLTLNTKTGDVVELEDFGEDLADVVARHSSSGTCFDSFDASAYDGAADAFSPTKDGLVLRWSMGTFAPSSCGSAALTIPWDDLEAPAKSASAKPTKTSAAQADSSCPDADLPAGADPRICQPTVKGAQKLATDEYGSTMIITESGNIWCDTSSEGLGCTRIEPYARFSLGSTGKAAKANYDDGAPAVEPVTLSYGQAATLGDYTCISQQVGLSCWNQESSHGLFLSRKDTVLW